MPLSHILVGPEVGAASETVTISAAQTQTFRGDVPHVYRGAGASGPAY